MKKALSLVISLVLAVQAAGCSRTPKLTTALFEKYVTEDLGLEKKEFSQDEDPYGYYDLDSTINNTDESARKIDHYVQVYSKATNNTVGNLYMIYTDYEKPEDAASYYEELSTAELELVNQNPAIHVVKSSNTELLVLTSKDQLTFTFESLYLRDDVILFTSIVLSASEIERMDADWIKKIDELCDDLHIGSPFQLEPRIEALIK